MFSKNSDSPTLLYTHIILKDNILVKSQSYQLAPPKIEFLREHIKDLVAKGVVEPSHSSCSSPWVQHPDKKPRMVIDYHNLNQHIIIEAIPLTSLNHSFNWFVGLQYFTAFDLNSFS